MPAGSQVAVVGPSGAGKSTLGGAPAALLGADRGPVDPHRRRHVRGDGLGRRPPAVAVVAQHDHLFDTTVRDNLRLGAQDADDDTTIWAAVRRPAAVDRGRSGGGPPRGPRRRVGEDGAA